MRRVKRVWKWLIRYTVCVAVGHAFRLYGGRRWACLRCRLVMPPDSVLFHV